MFCLEQQSHSLKQPILYSMSGHICHVLFQTGFLFDPLRTAITNKFWTALFEDMISDAEESLFFLPTRLGSMGVKDLVYQAPESFAILHACSKKIISAIRGASEFSVESYLDHIHAIHTTFLTTNNFVILKH